MASVKFLVHSSKISNSSVLSLIKSLPDTSEKLKKEALFILSEYLIKNVLSKEIDITFDNMELSDIKFNGYFAEIIFSSMDTK